MGLAAKRLPKELRERLGLKLGPGGRARPRLGTSLVGHVLLELRIPPPTVTHHDKRIVTRGDGRRTLADTPALIAARNTYLVAIPERPGPEVPPLAGAVVLHATFTFAADDVVDDAGDWQTDEPDLDNSVKVLKDVLAQRGYLDDDRQVSMEVLRKRVGLEPGVRVYLRSLVSPADDGRELPIERHPARLILPLPIEVPPPPRDTYPRNHQPHGGLSQ